MNIKPQCKYAQTCSSVTGIDRLVQSRQTNYSWQRVAMECILQQSACLSHIADGFLSVFFNHSLSLLLFVLITQKDCLCLRVWERLSKRDGEENTAKRGKKSIDLQRKGRVWSASRAFMMNGREIGTATLNILLLFNLSACSLLPPSSYYYSLLNKSFLCSRIQYRVRSAQREH